MSVRAVRAIAGAVDLPVGWDIGWHRQVIDRLLDADHAALGARLVRRLEPWGWTLRPEVSFNRYGDRGRIDLLGFHGGYRALLVAELKTLIVDGQDLLGALDVKARVASHVAREIGWQPRVVVPAIVVLDSTTARRRIADLAPLLHRYELRGHAAMDWLRVPAGAPNGILMLTKLPPGAGSDVRRAGRRRVRLRAHSPRSNGAAT